MALFIAGLVCAVVWILRLGRPGGRRMAILLGGALGGAGGGAFVLSFCGDTGRETVGGVIGGAIGGAVLAFLGTLMAVLERSSPRLLNGAQQASDDSSAL